MRALLLLVLLAGPAAALDIEHEEYIILGWNDACGVAVERYAFPKLGQGIHGEPITSRVGTIAIVTATRVVQTNWALEADGPNTYDRPHIERVRKQLRKVGFEKPGYAEKIRLDAPTAQTPGTGDVIFSTASLDAKPDAWPGPEWRWSAAHYNPLNTCVLLVYERAKERQRYKFVLARYENPAARTDRARAHTTNGRSLFENGDLEGGLAETEIGAKLAPELPGTRYNYAAMLALTGRLEESMKELQAAITRDRRYADKARDDEDFDSLKVRQDFLDLVRP